ncbi:hypothetical protein BGZ76_006764, partial [Entomortierella beljakovae]
TTRDHQDPLDLTPLLIPLNTLVKEFQDVRKKGGQRDGQIELICAQILENQEEMRRTGKDIADLQKDYK